VRVLKSCVFYLILSSVLVSAQPTSTDQDAAKLITRVKQTSASQFDSALPHMEFEKWLRGQVGTDAVINWVLRTGDGHDLPWVEADVSIHGRPGIVIMIEGAPEPKFRSLQLVRADEFAEWPRLSALPRAVRKARAG
jgi:hypothetical protein